MRLLGAGIRPHGRVDVFVPGEDCRLPLKSEVESDTVAHFRGMVDREFGAAVILIMAEWTLIVELASDRC